MRASYCEALPSTLAAEGTANRASGAAGRRLLPARASVAAATATATSRLTRMTRREWRKRSRAPGGPKPSVISRSWISE